MASAAAAATSPSSGISRFDYIGFDLDHTLARYRLTEFAPWLFGLLARHVVEHSPFPAATLLAHPFTQQGGQQLKALVWDQWTGHFVKLAAPSCAGGACAADAERGATVLAASHGYPSRMLTSVEIAACYPHGAVGFDGGRHPRWHTFHTYFETPAQMLVALMVSCIDAGDVPVADQQDPTKRYVSIFPALSAAYEHHLGASGRGDYFPAFEATPERFLHKRDAVATWLRDLRRQGKFLFLATNSRLDYTLLLCAFSFGPDWRDLFDLVIADCKKPSWFMQPGVITPQGLPHAPKPFYFPTATHVADTERAAATQAELRVRGTVVVHGNAPELHRLFEVLEAEKAAQTGQPGSSPRVIYFGDHIHADCVATSVHTSWCAGAIVEELEVHHDEPSTAQHKKHETFHALHTKLHAHPHDGFGSFFHHPPSSTSAPPAAGVASASSALEPACLTDEVAPPTSTNWSYWHSVLTEHCDVVVGCLTDLHEEDAATSPPALAASV